MNEINEILLRRKHKINIVESSFSNEVSKTEKAMVLSIEKNIEAYGFSFSPDVFGVLLTFTKDELVKFYQDLMPKLKRLVGADKEYIPMYPNFPEQVMNASDIELIINAIIHYATFGKWLTEYRKNERYPLFDDNKKTVLSIGNDNDIKDILQNLMSIKTSLSSQDKKYV